MQSIENSVKKFIFVLHFILEFNKTYHAKVSQRTEAAVGDISSINLNTEKLTVLRTSTFYSIKKERTENFLSNQN